MDFCSDNQVIIDFPRSKLILNANEEEGAADITFVKKRITSMPELATRKSESLT
jgi:hypothetical protein